MTDIPISNIFAPRNNWAVKSFKCRVNSFDPFAKKTARIISIVLGVNPLDNIRYRGRDNVQARQLYLVMMKKHTSWSMQKITELIRKDHATYYNSKNSIDNYYATDKAFRIKYDIIDKKISKLKP